MKKYFYFGLISMLILNSCSDSENKYPTVKKSYGIVGYSTDNSPIIRIKNNQILHTDIDIVGVNVKERIISEGDIINVIYTIDETAETTEATDSIQNIKVNSLAYVAHYTDVKPQNISSSHYAPVFNPKVEVLNNFIIADCSFKYSEYNKHFFKLVADTSRTTIISKDTFYLALNHVTTENDTTTALYSGNTVALDFGKFTDNDSTLVFSVKYLDENLSVQRLITAIDNDSTQAPKNPEIETLRR